MAHVIIFTDRAPESKHRFGNKLSSLRYTYTAGAHKIASVLRQNGFKVLVVGNCLSLTLPSIKNIIKNNSSQLLWVGISTSLFTCQSDNYNEYRQEWRESDHKYVNPGILQETHYESKDYKVEMPWADIEIGFLSRFLKKLNVPLILGGSYVTRIVNGGLKHLDDNTFIVRGNAEDWAKNFTIQRQLDNKYEPPYINNNSDYDSNFFKNSSLQWEAEDLIAKDDWLPIEIARGCAFKCSYCSYEHKGRFDLYRNPEIIREEIIRNYELFGVTRYALVDDLYNDSKEKVRILYDKVWSRLPFQPEWVSFMRLDMFWADPESIKIIKESGAKYGTFGIETLHDKAGKKVGKGLGKKRIIETLTRINEECKNELLVNAQFIAGLPHEPYESILETINWSMNTNLLHNVAWGPLWVTPPSINWKHNDTISPMAKNSDSYGFTWKDSVWTNDQGLTYDKCDELLAEHFYKKYDRFRVSFGNYPDLRVCDLTHDQIAELPKVPVDTLPLDTLGDVLENKIRNKLEKVFDLSI